MIKRLLVGIVLGILGDLLGNLGIPLLVILLCVGIVAQSSPTHSSAGPEGNSTPSNTVQTHSFGGKTNEAVVNAARTLVRTLYPCGDGHYKCYTTNFPANVLQYLDDACGDPHCPYAQSGNFQCVFFVLGVSYMAGQTLPAGPNAVQFWQTYQNVAGWQEIPANGAPEPGDLVVFSGPLSGPLANPFGHVAIIIDETLPGSDGVGEGSIQVAQANGLQAVENLPLLKTSKTHPLFRVLAWGGYNVLGYIRNAANA